jgi:hypothetical protein
VQRKGLSQVLREDTPDRIGSAEPPALFASTMSPQSASVLFSVLIQRGHGFALGAYLGK